MKCPLLTLEVHEALQAGLTTGARQLRCTLDLSRTESVIEIRSTGWAVEGREFPYLQKPKARTVYYWMDDQWQAVSRFAGSLIKLVPTEWGPPTFEIDGIKMLPTAKVSPYADAERKVALIQPRGKVVLDTCGGLGYFGAWCLEGKASRVQSYEKNADVIWLRGINPWSPEPDGVLSVTQGDIAEQIVTLASASVDAILHDPPRFGIAGELYSQAFYDQLARVIRRKGRLFHYTGTPNKLTSGRDVPIEVANRLRRSGFTTELKGDGVIAIKT